MSDKAKKTATSAMEKTKEVPAPMSAMRPFEEMDRMFEHFWPRNWMRPYMWERPLLGDLAQAFEHFEMKLPKVDVIDRETEVVVKAEVPGVSKDDLEISVDERTVTIRGKTRHEEKEEKGDYYRTEIRRGSFSRTVALPRDVDSSKAKANFRDGILELTLPKLAKSKRVSVKVQ